MKIKKRSGKLANLDLSNIRKQTKDACYQLNADYETLEFNANLSFVDGMESKEIQTVLIQSALNLIDVDKPDYVFVAARLVLYDLYHEMNRTYKKTKSNDNIYKSISLNDYLTFCNNINKLSYDSSVYDVEDLNNYIKSERDYLFHYLGIETLISRYLLKDNKKVIELPQHFFMSLAMFLAQNEDDKQDKAKEFYDVMSNLEFLMGTPSLSNGRTKEGNCFSCAVGSLPDDLEGIFDSFKEIALGSKFGSGWGYDITQIRALGGEIRGIEDAANGIVPVVKILNDIAVYVDQLGCVAKDTYIKVIDKIEIDGIEYNVSDITDENIKSILRNEYNIVL